ncbi:hypothetical protein EV175_004973, partial [Coemansia sp. RSA 1933]
KLMSFRAWKKSPSVRLSFISAPHDRNCYMRQIGDINNERLELSNAHSIGYPVISHTAPGIQGIADKAEAECAATITNDWAADQIKNHRDRMGAFACLSMHDPTQAAQELGRCVNELGFHGALLCNFQHAGADEETYLFYDQPAYDVFWEALIELDVPLYIHPAAPTGVIREKLYGQRPYLVGPPLSFANDVSLHILGIISNGVFDRFPKLKITIGHQGEHIPFDFWRINHWFEVVERPIAQAKGDTIENGCGWWDNDKKAIVEVVGGIGNYRAIGRENAKKMLKLGQFHDSDAPVN